MIPLRVTVLHRSYTVQLYIRKIKWESYFFYKHTTEFPKEIPSKFSRLKTKILGQKNIFSFS